MSHAFFHFWRRWQRKLGVSALGGLLLAVSSSVRAEGPRLSARVECAPAAGPGRILCQLSASAASGKLLWVDALVVQAPPFARPLRSRVVAQVAADPLGTATAKLALVASEPGQGELQLRVRAVVCEEEPSGEACAPEQVLASGKVMVTPAAPVPVP
jgi:hypothetical protein